MEQIRELQYELDRSRQEVQRVQQQQHKAGFQNGVNPRKLKDLEEENTFLRTQVCTLCIFNLSLSGIEFTFTCM